jgi:Domain of unknown function (DUF4397)
MRRTCSAAVIVGVSCVLAIFLILFATGCGGSNGAHVRLVNAVPIQSNIDMLIDGKNVASGIAYGMASGYVSVGSGSRHLQIEPSGTSSPFTDEDVTLSSGSSNTVVATSGAANDALVLTDDNTTPSSGNISLRVINAAQNLSTVDVYVVTAGTNISSVGPTYSNVTVGSATGYSTVAAGSYQVIFTLPATKAVLLSTTSLSFTSGQVRTVIALDGQSGGLTTSVITDLN